MTIRIPAVLLVLASTVACETNTVTAPPESAPEFAVAGRSGCYVVQGAISERGVFPNFTGTISGDLEGTTTTQLSFDVAFTGAAIHNPGERTLLITGGNVPELFTRTLHQSLGSVTISEASSQIRINERTQVDGGVRRGTLTTHGTLDLTVDPWEVELEYQGVICP